MSCIFEQFRNYTNEDVLKKVKTDKVLCRMIGEMSGVALQQILPNKMDQLLLKAGAKSEHAEALVKLLARLGCWHGVDLIDALCIGTRYSRNNTDQNRVRVALNRVLDDRKLQSIGAAPLVILVEKEEDEVEGIAQIQRDGETRRVNVENIPAVRSTKRKSSDFFEDTMVHKKGK